MTNWQEWIAENRESGPLPKKVVALGLKIIGELILALIYSVIIAVPVFFFLRYFYPEAVSGLRVFSAVTTLTLTVYGAEVACTLSTTKSES